MRYDKILFDLDNTLIDFDDAEKNALRLTFNEFNIPYESDYLKIYHDINDKYWKMLEKGLIERKVLIIKRFEDFFNLLTVTGVDCKAFNDTYLSNIANGKKLLPNAVETVKAVFELGAKCYLVTNGNKIVQNKRLQGQPFIKYISGVAISEDVGYKKPDKEFFIGAEKMFNVKFDSKTIVVGDSLTSDILGGINAGLDTCFVNTKNQDKIEGITPTYEIRNLPDLIEIVK